MFPPLVKSDIPKDFEEHFQKHIKEINKLKYIEKTEYQSGENRELNIFFKEKIIKLISKENYAFYYKIPKFRLKIFIGTDMFTNKKQLYLLAYQFDLNNPNKELIFKRPKEPPYRTYSIESNREWDIYLNSPEMKEVQNDLLKRHPYIHEDNKICFGEGEIYANNLQRNFDIYGLTLLFNNILKVPRSGSYFSQLNNHFLLPNKNIKQLQVTDIVYMEKQNFWSAY